MSRWILHLIAAAICLRLNGVLTARERCEAERAWFQAIAAGGAS